MFKHLKTPENYTEVGSEVESEPSASSEFQVLSIPSNVEGTSSPLSNIHLSLNLIPCDLSPEEIQTRLRDLLKENIELKDMLYQNNLVMSKQLKHLLQWQQEMSQLQSYYKERFEETRSVIEKLRSENAKLKEHSAIDQGSNWKCLLPCKNSEPMREPTLDQKCSPTSSLFQQVNESEKKLNKTEISLETSHDQDQNKTRKVITKLMEEITRLKQTLAEQQTINQEDKKHLAEAQGKFQSLLKDYQALLKSWETFEQEHTDKGKLSEEFYEIQIKLLNEQIDNLTAKLLCNEEALSSTAAELSRLKERTNVLRETEKIEILQAQVESYRTDYKKEFELREKVEVEKQKLVEENHSLRLQLNGKSGKDATATAAAYNRPWTTLFSEEKKPDYNKLCKRNLLQTSGKYTVSNRQNLGNEFQNTEKNYSKTCDNFGAPNPLSSPNHFKHAAACEKKVRVEAPDDDIYLCPKCNLGFTEFQPLENHVNSCLDKDDPFI